ncbi:lysozyme [Secundilactobacillus kimchicus]|uniref:Glycoside hydrolase family protein n=1 Tax=Secundilactobacillus kimchicus JCM 15530 TaxID=1302272 RepID=A0A0R1I0A6_9LACO|nr:GH25 family lysozyme [Secundilactobacillus kimchicus]KRK48695.1 glycoside hydrolase family protein [Secundilactobacillus kimchicus JCM 15530]MBT9672085.1 lysozyme [Secundilactobacillus kimchicus]
MKKTTRLTGLMLSGLAVGLMLSTRPAHASLTPSSTLPRTDMVDLASYQGNLGQSDFDNLAQQGVKAVTVKATEGTSYVNPYLSQQVQYAQNAGLSVNFYHFAHFTSASEATAEAQAFINAVKSVTSSTNIVMVVDFESSELAGLSKTANNANLATFDSVLNQAGYNKTDLYTMSSWVGNHIDTNDANKGWIANWPANPTGENYTSANAWQWASDYVFNGEHQNLDVSQLNNSYYLGGATTSTTPTNQTTSTTPTTTPQSGQEDPTMVKLPAPKQVGSQYSKSRLYSVKLVWRGNMGHHTYTTTKGARYSAHLGTRYGYNSDLPDVTWVTDKHEKLYRKATHDYIIYYHVKSTDGQHGGWIWRGYLK